MAGAGYKLFTTGQVLTAAEVNTYLQEQVIMVFNDATARTTALSGVLAEGMVSYLKSTKVVEIYNGTAWASLDDPNAIQNTIVDAKGDLISASAADTPARLAVGNNGETLIADSSTSTGLRWQGDYAAGKNKIINGDFNIWQRGTSITLNNASGYTADRWLAISNNNTTVSQQTFTPGTAPVSGYEGTFFLRWNRTSRPTAFGDNFIQRIEDVRTFAGQTATVSFWAKAGSSLTLTDVSLSQVFGSGGSAEVTAGSSGSLSITTSWQRFSFVVNVPSVSGKTIGTSSYLQLVFSIGNAIGTSFTLDLWGFQVEAGSVATAFQTATGTLAGELQAAQRYYQKSYDMGTTVPTNTTQAGVQYFNSPNVAQSAGIGTVILKSEMRAAPTLTIFSYTSSQTGRVSDNNGLDLAASSGTAGYVGTKSFYVYNNSGGTITAGNGGFVFHYSASAEL